MKKLIALMLCLVLALSMSVTAFAAGEQTGTTTLTAEVPEPSYTIHIPADTTLEYKNTELQTIGDVFVSDYDTVLNTIYCRITAQDLTSGSNTIPVVYKVSGSEMGSSHTYYVLEKLGDGTFAPYTLDLSAEISQEAWAAAAPGTYTATLTFSFYFGD